MGNIATKVEIDKWALSHFLFYRRTLIIAGKKNEDLVNENIRFKEVLVIDFDGSQLGVMNKFDALQKAYDQDLDLLCVSPNSNPPVCKILDYGRYRYESQKKAKEAKKNQQTSEVKPLRLSPVIDTHDFETKIKQATKWLQDGTKVKVDMRFRGRMMTRQEVGMAVMNDFIEKLSEISNVDKTPKLEGNIMSCVLMPKKKIGGKANAKDEN